MHDVTPRDFSASDSTEEEESFKSIKRLASENTVVIFTKNMCHCSKCDSIKILLDGMGVKSRVHELDKDPKGKELERALISLLGSVTAVFIGGKLVGNMDKVMYYANNGTLDSLLKEAGALPL